MPPGTTPRPVVVMKMPSALPRSTTFVSPVTTHSLFALGCSAAVVIIATTLAGRLPFLHLPRTTFQYLRGRQRSQTSSPRRKVVLGQTSL